MLHKVTRLIQCRNTRTAALTAALLACTAPARAQQGDPLAGLVQEALRANLGLAQQRSLEQRALAQQHEARGLFLPGLTLEARYSEQSGTLNLGDFVNPAYAALNQLTGSNSFPTNLDITLPMRHESRLRLTQPVFNEVIRQSYTVARERSSAQRYQRIAAARTLAAQVQAAYFDVAAARSVVGIDQSSLLLVRENTRVAGRLVAASQATPEVVFRARAEESDVEQKLAEAQERVDAAGRQLDRLLGRTLETPVDSIPESAFCFELPASADSAVTHALAQREELRQAGAGVRAAQAGVGVASAALLPSLAVAVDYGFQGSDLSFGRKQDFIVGSVVVSWNLFDGGRNLAARQEAKAEAERARLARRDAADAVAQDVRTAFEAAVVARSAMAAAQARESAAQRTFDLVRRKYAEGEASQIEFVDARTSLTNAQLNRTLTFYRYAVRYVDFERAAALRELE